MKIILNSVSAFSEARDKFSPEKSERNEDSFVLPLSKKNGFLFGVADGLGSYLGAKEASSFVCNYIENLPNISHEYIEKHLSYELKGKFQQFIENQSNDYSKASTTLSFCFLDTNGLSIWHVGDCRVYLKKENKLAQVTSDHTQYQQLLDQKIYNKRELKEQNINKSILINAISTLLELENDYIYIPSESLKMEYGHEISIYLMSDGAHHFWEQRKKFSPMTMGDIVKFGNALKRRIENKGPIDDYTLIGATFKLTD